MKNLLVTDLSGNKQILTGFTLVNREGSVNGEKTLSFSLYPTAYNTLSFSMVNEESMITDDKGNEYIVKKVNRVSKGTSYYKQVVCIHRFFCDFMNQYIYETFTQVMSFNVFLNTLFNDSGYTYEIIGSFTAFRFEDMGDNNKLALFQLGLSSYGYEFEIIGNTHIRLVDKIGRSTGFQMRYNHNIRTLDEEVNTQGLFTQIKGFGKKNEDGSYVVTGEYTSPNASIFGIRIQDPIRNEDIETQSDMDAALVEALNDEPEMSILIDFIDLRLAGFPYANILEGDEIYLIHEPMNINFVPRVVKVKEVLDEHLEPIAMEITIATMKKYMTDIIGDIGNRQDSFLNKNGQVKFSYLDDAVKRATEAMQSAQTQLEFNNGIIARDIVDPNRVVIYNSAGIGISLDGGQTITEALTYQGFVASAGVVGQFSADNVRIGATTDIDIPALEFNSNGLRASTADPTKYVELNGSGLISKKGALTVERPDGYQVINDGYLNMEFALGSAKPSWREENATDPTQGVTVFNTYWRTRSTTWKTCDAFFFEHKTRYLHFDFALFTENISGSRAYVKVVDSLQNPTTLAYYSTDVIEANVDPSTNFVIDLGTPTGTMKVVYIQIQNLLDTAYTYCRTTRQYLKG